MHNKLVKEGNTSLYGNSISEPFQIHFSWLRININAKRRFLRDQILKLHDKLNGTAQCLLYGKILIRHSLARLKLLDYE